MRSLAVATLLAVTLVAAAFASAAYDWTVVAFALAAVTAATTWRCVPTPRTPLTTLDALVITLGAWLLVATMAADVATVATNHALRFVLFFFAFTVLRRLAVAHRDVRALTALGAVSVAGVCAVLWLHFTEGFHLGGPFVYRHMFAMTVLVGALVGAGAVHARQAVHTVPRLWPMAVVAFAAFAIFLLTGLGGSRGVLLAGAAGLITVFVLGDRRARVLGAWLGGGGGTGLVVANALTSGTVAARAATLADPVIVSNIRLVLWESVLPLIAAKPLIGYGPGMLTLVWPPHRQPGEWTAGLYAHNSFIDVAVVAGLPAALLIAVLFALALHAGVRACREQPARVWLVAAVAAMLVHSLVDFSLLSAGVWLLFGACLGVLSGHAPTLPASVSVPVKRWLSLVSGAVVLGLAVYAGTSAVGYHHQQAAQRHFAAGDAGAAFERIGRAIAWWPAAEPPRTQRAHIIAVTVLEADNARSNPMAPAAFAAARADAATAIRLNPYRISAYATAARIERAGASLGLATDGDTVAIALLDQALAVDPRNVGVRMDIARLQVGAGDEVAALTALLGGLHYRHRRSDARAAYYAFARELAERIGDAEALARIPQN